MCTPPHESGCWDYRTVFSTDCEQCLRCYIHRLGGQQRESNPERYWMTRLCVFQVCRREEAAQLALKDIQEHADWVQCIHEHCEVR